MKNPLKSDLSSNLGLLVARIPLGLYFALAGYAHFKTQNFATQYAAALPHWMPSEAGKGYSSTFGFAARWNPSNVTVVPRGGSV